MIHFLTAKELNLDVVAIYNDDTSPPEFHGTKMIFGSRRIYSTTDKISVFTMCDTIVASLDLTEENVHGKFLSYEHLNDEEKFAYEIGGIDSLIGEPP